MHKTFISFYHENEQDLKNEIIKKFRGEHFIDNSVGDGEIATTLDDESIMVKIRQNYISDSTVTLVLIGNETHTRSFINAEIQASLCGENPSGLLGVIRDEIYDQIFTTSSCSHRECDCSITIRRKLPGYVQFYPIS